MLEFPEIVSVLKVGHVFALAVLVAVVVRLTFLRMRDKCNIINRYDKTFMV